MRGCYPEKKKGMRAFFSSLQPQSHVEQRLVQHVGLGGCSRPAGGERQVRLGERVDARGHVVLGVVDLLVHELVGARARVGEGLELGRPWPLISGHPSRPPSCASSPNWPEACCCARACGLTAQGRAHEPSLGREAFADSKLRADPSFWAGSPIEKKRSREREEKRDNSFQTPRSFTESKRVGDNGKVH